MLSMDSGTDPASWSNLGNHWNIPGTGPTSRGMGKSLLPPGCVTIPALARAMGLRHTTIYAALEKGRGPRLTPVEPAPFTYPEPGSKRSHCVTIPDAISWLEGRPDATRWSDVIRTLRVQRITD